MIAFQELLSLLGLEEAYTTIPTIVIENALPITDESFNEASIGWCSDSNRETLRNIKKGTVLVSKNLYKELKNASGQLNLLPVENPRASFLKVLQQFFVPKKVYGTVHPTAIIDESVLINLSMVEIAPNVVIEKGCVVGNRVSIGANTVIKSDTIIGDDCVIGSNNTIGGIGFGYELNEANEYELMPHIGNVVLSHHVEIGNNVCVDRAVMGSTFIGEQVKIDNLVHIAHGVHIGRNSLIIANAMIAGSVTIGENVWIAPSSSIRQKLLIADNALVGLGSVVVRNVDKQTIVAGNPAKQFDKK